ncbi:hypothetical protein ACYVMD_004562 [Vibrio parahaemolyticus]
MKSNDYADDDLTAVHNAQVTAIKDAMTMVKTVETYDPTKNQQVITPAVMLEAVEMKPGRTVTGGRMAVKVEFAAHCYLSAKTDNVQLEVRNMAARLLQIVNRNRWGLENAEQPENLAAFPGQFSKEKGFDSWIVQWEQDFHFGPLWEDPDYLPTELWLGEAPDIGAAHKDDYEKLTNE